MAEKPNPCDACIRSATIKRPDGWNVEMGRVGYPPPNYQPQEGCLKAAIEQRTKPFTRQDQRNHTNLQVCPITGQAFRIFPYPRSRF